MSGQSAALGLKEACKMQKDIQVSGSHAQTHGGKGAKSGGGGPSTDLCSTPSHQMPSAGTSKTPRSY